MSFLLIDLLLNSSALVGVLSTFLVGGRPLFLFRAHVTSADPPDAVFPAFFRGRPGPLLVFSVPSAVFASPPSDAVFASPPFLALLSFMPGAEDARVTFVLGAMVVGVPVDGASICSSSKSSFCLCPGQPSGYFA